MTLVLNNLELGHSIKAHSLEPGLSMSTMTPSNTTPLHTLTRHAMTVTLNLLLHSLILMAIAANSMTEDQNNVVSLTLILSLLLTRAAHAMVERLYPREKLVTTVKTGTKPLQDMLQIASRDSSAYMKNKLMLPPSQECLTSAQNLKVLGLLKIDSGTGIIVGTLMTIMMATGPLKMEINPECGTTQKEALLKESGKMTTVMHMALGQQKLAMNLSEMSS